jgi:hypothetical protein
VDRLEQQRPVGPGQAWPQVFDAVGDDSIIGSPIAAG